MKAKYTLVVVDVQYGFLKSDSLHGGVYCLAKNILAQIDRANKDGATVMFVEFACWGETMMTLARRAKKKCFAVKTQMDGSEEVLDEAKRRRLPLKFKVCGIYTSQCVVNTLKGLLEKGYPAKALEGCCGDTFESAQSRGLYLIRLEQERARAKKRDLAKQVAQSDQERLQELKCG
jgi:nicotinamidase-related amidase